MSSSIPSSDGRKRLVVLACWLTLLAGCDCERSCERSSREPKKPPAGSAGSVPAPAATARPIPSLGALAGEIEWRAQPDGAWQKASQGQALPEGALLRTGKQGSVVLVFGDSQIRVEGAGLLGVTHSGQGWGLKVERGEMALSVDQASASGYRLEFGSASEVVVLRQGRAEVKVEPSGVRIQMVMGQAVILRRGESVSFDAGGSLFIQTAGGAPPGSNPQRTELFDPQRLSRIRVGDAREFHPPAAARSELTPGTEVRVPGRAAVEWVDETGSRILLGAGTQATFVGAFVQGGVRDASLGLQTGSLRLRLKGQPALSVVERVEIQRGWLVTSDREQIAEVNIRREVRGTLVEVLAGESRWEHESLRVAVKAGQRLFIPAQGNPGAPSPLPVPQISALEGQDLRIYYDQLPSFIGLTTEKPTTAGDRLVEVFALDSEPKLLLRQSMEGPTFVLSTEPPGGFLFRMVQRGDEKAAGQSWTRVEWRKDPSSNRAASSRWSNVVPDTGVQTTILFPSDVPVLTFQWNARPQAARYRFRLYAEDDLERPILERELKETRFALASGRLKEGVYFWFQTALDARGVELGSSEMNKLVLLFDNAAPLLRIDSPRSGEPIAGRKVHIRGQLIPGARLSVGKFVVALSADGRFDQVLETVDPRSPLVFQVKKRGVGRTLFVRTPAR